MPRTADDDDDLVNARATIAVLTTERGALQTRVQQLEQLHARVEPVPLSLVVVDKATGDVVGEWSGGADRPPVLLSGQIAVDKAAHPTVTDFHHRRWNGTAFELRA